MSLDKTEETTKRDLALDVALQNNARAVERMLDKLLPKAEGPEHRLLNAMRYATFAGGKRLRPFLVTASAELFRVSKERALRVAAALECLHTYSLVHDDLPCMDDSPLRRGQPSVHVAFDEATAVLAGDGLLTYAFEILADRATHDDPAVRAELVSELAIAAGPRGMVGGQMIDLDSEGKQLDIGAINRLQHMKTGALIIYAAEAGAILGRGSIETRHALKGFAQNLGLAFQITDDILDAEGDPEKVGKQLGKDAEAEKATFLTILGPERAKMQARMLSEQAVEHLDVFGESAELVARCRAFRGRTPPVILASPGHIERRGRRQAHQARTLRPVRQDEGGCAARGARTRGLPHACAGAAPVGQGLFRRDADRQGGATRGGRRAP